MKDAEDSISEHVEFKISPLVTFMFGDCRIVPYLCQMSGYSPDLMIRNYLPPNYCNQVFHKCC